jgi:hypothetical protein
MALSSVAYDAVIAHDDYCGWQELPTTFPRNLHNSVKNPAVGTVPEPEYVGALSSLPSRFPRLATVRAFTHSYPNVSCHGGLLAVVLWPGGDTVQLPLRRVVHNYRIAHPTNISIRSQRNSWVSGQIPSRITCMHSDRIQSGTPMTRWPYGGFTSAWCRPLTGNTTTCRRLEGWRQDSVRPRIHGT